MRRLERYLETGATRLRLGYTTGTCAAAATYAATTLLATGVCPAYVRQDTPARISCLIDVEEAKASATWARCAVMKDAGDDADVTDGITVVATVERRDDPAILIVGGQGVGRVTRAGLDQPVGEAAINSVPRQMISEAAEAALAAAGATYGLVVTISVPQGREIAAHTFNPRLGIVDGISILGTSGIVRPMSEAALVDTIALELSVRAAAGVRDLVCVPGNLGAHAAEHVLNLDASQAVTCSNFIGDTIDIARAKGFSTLLVVGQIGKLAKVASGVWNTHSRVADARAETLCTHAALAGASVSVIERLFDAPTTDAMVTILDEAGLTDATFASMAQRLKAHLDARSCGALTVEAVVFGKGDRELFRTAGATGLVRRHALRQTTEGGHA